MENQIIQDDLFFSRKFSDYYSIFGSIEIENETEIEVAIWTNTIHFENDKIRYKMFSNLETAKNYILKTLTNYNPI